jgi:hypothetical protein
MTTYFKYLLTIVLYFTAMVVEGQQVTFEKNYDFGYADVAYCVQQTPDSGYIMAGRQGIAPFYEKMVIAKTDKYGIQQWSKILGSNANSAWANYVVNCTNGGYAAVGYKYDVNYRYDVFVVRLNNNGDTLWTRNYGTTAFNEKGTCIKETSDKGFVISFWDSNLQTGFLKIDSLGNEVFWKKYNIYNNGYTNYFTNCNVLNDGGFIACGIAQVFINGTTTATHGIIMRTDSLGDSLWVKKFIGTNAAEFYETQQTNDGNIIIGGIANVLAIGNWGGYILKLNLSGDTIWTKAYQLSETSNINSIHQCADGGYIAIGSIFNNVGTSNLNQNAYMVKLGANGNIQWTKEFGDPIEDEGGYYVRQTFDGGYIITGVYEPGVNLYLVKTDSLGNLTTSINEINNNLNYSIYPNPTQNNLYVSFTKEDDYFIKIFDVNGLLTYTSQILKSNATSTNVIDISSFNNGMYFLQIQSVNITHTKKIIKIN